MLRWSYCDSTLRSRWGYCWGGVGWGGCDNVHVSCCKVMRRGCYVDVTLIILWFYVEEPLRLLLGWGGVGWGGVITFMSLACKVVRRGCYVDVTLIILWFYVEEPLRLLLGWGGVRWGGVGGVWWRFNTLMLRWWWCGVGLGWVCSGYRGVLPASCFWYTSILFNIMSEIDDGLQVIYICYAAAGYNIEYFVQHHVRYWWWTSSIYICYAADGYDIEYFVQNHVRYWWWTSSYIYATLQMVII